MIFKLSQINKHRIKALLILCCLTFPSSNLFAQQMELDTVSKVQVRKYPVIFFTDTLFYISSKLGQYSAAERAENQSDKLALLIENDALDLALFTTVEDEVSTEILYGERIIASITKGDGDALRKEKGVLAQRYMAAIKASYTTH